MEIDYYSKLKQYSDFINNHSNHKYGVMYNNTFILFYTTNDVIKWRLRNNIDHKSYILYNMEKVINNYTPIIDIR